MIAVTAARAKDPDASILKRKLGSCNSRDENGAEIERDEDDVQ
jgi:hypothetical protein